MNIWSVGPSLRDIRSSILLKKTPAISDSRIEKYS
jgi:hypothetical protein